MTVRVSIVVPVYNEDDGINGFLDRLFDLDPEELDAYFPDIAPFVPECYFSDCTHTVEPGCAVIAAVEEGRVSDHRYESYVRLRDEHQKLADMYWWGIDED